LLDRWKELRESQQACGTGAVIADDVVALSE
jgi:hypothetical protein